MERIGKYQIQAQIGRGGFGRVYRAFDPTVGRTVAIKVMLGDGGELDSELLGRFRIEANATGGLRHKNIITVYDYGEHEGMPYLVIEYLEGRDLQKVMSEGQPLSLLEKVTIMEQVAEGLQHAHQNDVVHRDVKPANIMILNDGSVKIMDFGIARVLREQGTRITQQGNIIGTVAYMAPEQFWVGETDHRSDIFAYGVIFYELISGLHPFRTPKSENVKIMYNIGAVHPPPVSSLVPDCPPELNKLIVQAMEKDRELRYQSFEDVRFDVAPIQRELKRRFVEEKMVTAQQAFDSGRVEEAQALVREVLTHDPSNVNGRWMREEIQKHSRNKNVRERVNQLAAAAKQHLSEGDLPKAIENLEGALKLDSANTALKPLLEKARAELAKANRITALIETARRQLDAQNLSGAHRLITECLEEAPGHDQATALLVIVRERIERRDREQRMEATLTRAKDLAVAGSYNEALALLDELIADFPGADHVKGIAERLRARQQQEKQRRLANEIGLVKGLINARQWEEALNSLERLTSEHPSHHELSLLIAQVREELRAQRKADEIERITREAQRLGQSEAFDQASSVLEKGLQKYPADKELEKAARWIAEERTRYVRDQAIQTAARRAGELRNSKHYREALAELDEAIERWRSTDLSGFRNLIEAEWKAEERMAALASALRSIEEFGSQGRWKDAVQAAQDALRLYPGDLGLADLLAKSQNSLQRQTLTRKEDEIESFIVGQQFAEAIGLADAAIREHPAHGKFAQLKRKAEQARFRQQREEACEAALTESRKLRKTGDVDNAIRVLERLDAIYERHEKITELLDELTAEKEELEARRRAEEEEQRRRQAELARIEQEGRERAERERAAREAEALERARKEKEAEEQAAREREAKERAAREEAEALERVRREKLAQEQAAREREAQERAAREAEALERARKQKEAEEQAALERETQERAGREEAEALERARKEKEAQDQAARERETQERAAREVEALERARKEKLAQEQAAREREAQERAAREAEALERARKEKLAQEQAAREREAKERAAREAEALERARKEKLAQEQAAREREAKERAAREEAEALERARKEKLAQEQAAREREALERARKQKVAEERAAEQKAEREQQERIRWERIQQILANLDAQADRGDLDGAAATVKIALREFAGERTLIEKKDWIQQQRKQRKPTVLPAAPSTTPPPEIQPVPPPKKNVLMLGGVAVAVLAAVGIYFAFRGGGGSDTSLLVSVAPAGASAVVNGQTCRQSECRFALAKGSYEVEARLEGHRSVRLPITIGDSAPSPLRVILEPYLARLRVSTNLEAGVVTLDGRRQGALVQGELAIENSPAGKHTIEVTAPGGAHARLQFETAPGRLPVILAPVETTDLQALALARLGANASVMGDGKARTVAIDDRKAGELGPNPISLGNVSEGTHELRIEDGSRTLRFPVAPQIEPTVTLFARVDRDAGFLLVDAHEPDVVVFANGKLMGKTGPNGVFQVPLPAAGYSVTVEKSGFKPAPVQRVRIARDAVQQLALRLEPSPAELSIADAAAGTQVFADRRLLGAVGGTSVTFALPAGPHDIELRRDGYTSKQFAMRFGPGGRAVIAGRDAQLSRIAEPKPVKSEPKPEPPPNNVQVQSAEARRLEQLQGSRDIAALEQFRREFPQSTQLDVISRRIELVEWENVRTRKESGAIEGFLAKYPRTTYRDEATSLLAQMEKERLDRQKAETARTELATREKADAQAVLQTLIQLSAAYGSKDGNEISRLYPAVSRQLLNSLRRDIQSLSVQLRPAAAPQVTGDTASVQVERSVATLFKGENKPRTESDRVTIGFRRSGGAWVVDSIR